MKITAILCTYNRSQGFATALDSLAGSIVPGNMPWEVLVADNNSSDQTEAVGRGVRPQASRTLSLSV